MLYSDPIQTASIIIHDQWVSRERLACHDHFTPPVSGDSVLPASLMLTISALSYDRIGASWDPLLHSPTYTGPNKLFCC